MVVDILSSRAGLTAFGGVPFSFCLFSDSNEKKHSETRIVYSKTFGERLVVEFGEGLVVEFGKGLVVEFSRASGPVVALSRGTVVKSSVLLMAVPSQILCCFSFVLWDNLN